MGDRQSGSYGDPGVPDTFGYVVATVAAAPFLQAIATHFGNKLAGRIDESTRSAVRRFLRRESERPDVELTPTRTAFHLLDEAGWEIEIKVDLPAEALGQLLAIQHATRPELLDDPPPCLEWRQSAWWLLGLNERRTVFCRWDVAAGRWDETD